MRDGTFDSEIETYSPYLNGDVHGYIISNESGDEVDSCFGIYGYDNAEQEAESQIAYLVKAQLKIN